MENGGLIDWEIEWNISTYQYYILYICIAHFGFGLETIKTTVCAYASIIFYMFELHWIAKYGEVLHVCFPSPNSDTDSNAHFPESSHQLPWVWYDFGPVLEVVTEQQTDSK